MPDVFVTHITIIAGEIALSHVMHTLISENSIASILGPTKIFIGQSTETGQGSLLQNVYM